MKVVIDRIEGPLAVLLISDEESISINIPIRFLPAGVKAGDHLDLHFSLDEQSRANAEKRVKDLLHDLTEHSDPSEKNFKL